MKLEKAIELITFENRATLPPRNDDFWSAVLLGREALKAWKQFREGRWVSGRYTLPGETEE